MTFALKDFDTLKKQFKDAVETILRREAKGTDKKVTIDELPVKRKEEILFLRSVLNELETRVTGSKSQNLKPFAEIFYGAMLVIKKDIKENLGWGEKAENSLLYTSLDEIMGITEKNAPSNHQYVSYYTALNHFVPLVFKEFDSRLGLKSSNALDAVDIDKLATLITSSYQLEEAARKEVTKNFVDKGGVDTHINGYKVTKDTLARSLAGFGTLADLKSELHSLILDERADKNVSNVSSLSNKDRVAQIRSLEVLAEILSDPKVKTIKDSERVAILAGMMLIVREQIGHEYSKEPFNTDDIAPTVLQNGSVMHTGLSKILGIKELSREDARALITAAQNFVTYMTVERTENKGIIKDAVRTKNIFADIAGFNLVSVLDLMDKLIKCCRVDALQRCVVNYKKELEALKPKESSSSYASYLNVKGWLGKKTTSAETAPDDDLDVDTKQAVNTL